MDLFNNEFLSDIKLKYKDNIYICHKQILSKSLFFRRIFQNENNFNSIQDGILEIKDKDGYEFKDFETSIKYIYGINGINDIEEIDFLLICKDLQFLEVPIYERDLYNVVKSLVFDNEITTDARLTLYPSRNLYTHETGWNNNTTFNLLYDEFFDDIIVKLYHIAVYYSNKIKNIYHLFYSGRVSRLIDKRLIINDLFDFHSIILCNEILVNLDEKTLDKYNKWKSIKCRYFTHDDELKEQDEFLEKYRNEEYKDDNHIEITKEYISKLKYEREIMKGD